MRCWNPRGSKIRRLTSSDEGSLFYLTGESAKDFAFEELFPRSGASGDEAIAYVGNDILYGRQGRLESVFATQNFGDVDATDVSIGVSDSIEDFTDWTIIYNSRNQKVYCVPSGQSQIWVLYKPLLVTNLSPWSKWTTLHSMAMNPTAIMNMLDPQDGLEYVALAAIILVVLVIVGRLIAQKLQEGGEAATGW